MAPRPRTECFKSLGMTGLRKWAIALTICVLCITVSYYWVDRQVAYFVHNELRGYRDIFDVATRLPKLIGPFVTACTLVLNQGSMRRWRTLRLPRLRSGHRFPSSRTCGTIFKRKKQLLRSLTTLDQEQEPKAPGSEARGRGGLG